jgi:hypothetical protein
MAPLREASARPWGTAVAAVVASGVAVSTVAASAVGLALALLGTGAVLAGYVAVGAIGQRRLADRARTTDGTVLRSEAVEQSPLFRERSTDFEAAVTYRYRVAGREYEGSDVWPGRIRPHAADGARRYVEQFLREYPEGATVEVHYDPAEPSRAFLEPHRGTGGYLVVAAAATLALVGGGVVAALHWSLP